MTIAPDWKYANTDPLFHATPEQLRVMNLMRQYDQCSLWHEQRINELTQGLERAEEQVNQLSTDVKYWRRLYDELGGEQ